MIKAELTLKSQPDLVKFRVGLISENEIKQVVSIALFDQFKTFRLSVSEKIRKYLGLELIGERFLELADGTEMLLNYAEAVEVRFQNRRTIAEPLIVENYFDVVFGSFLVNDLGLSIDNEQQRLFVNKNHRLRV